jgi:hypothetical protein
LKAILNENSLDVKEIPLGSPPIVKAWMAERLEKREGGMVPGSQVT